MDDFVSSSITYGEFRDPRLASLYDVLNPFGDDLEFWCLAAKNLSASSIIDFGCGTGALTCELAKRGHQMIGVEPAKAMLEIAQRRQGSEHVRWIEGGAEKLDGLQADLVLMTSHVAQFLLDEEECKATLKSIYSALRSGAHLIFDSKNPLGKPWGKWTRDLSSKKFDTPLYGEVEKWYELSSINGNLVRYEIHYLFSRSGEEVVSANELIYRTQSGIAQSLSEAGFIIKNICGDWDSGPATSMSPEMIFIATKP